MMHRNTAIIVSLALALGACSKPAPQPAPAPAPAAKPPAEAPKKSEPAAKPKPTMQFGPNLLQNGRLTAWENEAPMFWKVAEGAGDAWTPVLVKRIAGQKQGGWALQFPAPAKGGTLIAAQKLNPQHIIPGKTLYFSGVVLADRKGQAQMVVSYRENGQVKKVRAEHPGTGSWRSLNSKLVIPAKADPASFRVELFRNPGADGRVIFSELAVAYEAKDWPPQKAAPQAVPAAAAASAAALAPASPVVAPAPAQPQAGLTPPANPALAPAPAQETTRVKIETEAKEPPAPATPAPALEATTPAQEAPAAQADGPAKKPAAKAKQAKPRAKAAPKKSPAKNTAG